MGISPNPGRARCCAVSSIVELDLWNVWLPFWLLQNVGPVKVTSVFAWPGLSTRGCLPG